MRRLILFSWLRLHNIQQLDARISSTGTSGPTNESLRPRGDDRPERRGEKMLDEEAYCGLRWIQQFSVTGSSSHRPQKPAELAMSLRTDRTTG